MPELPEVETVVRSLRPVLVGRTIAAVWTSGKPLRMRRKADAKSLRAFCAGAEVRAVSRRAKYILVDLHRGRGSSAVLMVHLGMTGRLRVEDARAPRAKHTHVAWTLANGGELRFVDPRRFGSVRVANSPTDLPELAALGPDALAELTVASFGGALATSRAPIKSFLLDQRRVAGLGNIYVSEALHRARLHPRTPARRARAKAGPLVAAIRQTLELGIANCGTSFRDFVDANGKPGTNFDALLVYDREGKPCLTCGNPIRRQVDAGRATYFCARCQKG
jgi:formamidopyrimidine-DNA glycosylase